MLIYLFERARRAGLAKTNTLVLPVTQEHLADAMGLSIVHTNKTLQRLRATGWLAWRRQELIIYDRSNAGRSLNTIPWSGRCGRF
jgi:CRP/FNR family transcriptional regulator, anaerobic regulatory protein